MPANLVLADAANSVEGRETPLSMAAELTKRALLCGAKRLKVENCVRRLNAAQIETALNDGAIFETLVWAIRHNADYEIPTKRKATK
jgi:hypothetical protein